MAQSVLITGATGGMGGAFARVFVEKGYHVILTGRDMEKLDAMKKSLSTIDKPVTTIVHDLSTTNGPEQLMNELKQKGQTVDILVNNAGFGLFGEFKQTDLAKEQDMIDVNVKALTALTKLVLPDMLERRSGWILNVSSTAAFQPGPLMAVYYATKAYVESFSVALGVELRGSGVSVTCLCPGPTKTGFEEHAELGRSKLFKSGLMDADTVARVAFRALIAEKPIVIPGVKNKTFAFLTRFISRHFAARVAKWIQSPVR